VRNVFLFIRRYFNFLFFLVLQIISLSFLFRYNKFHEAIFMNVALEISGSLNKRFNTVSYYFQLKKTNEALLKENERLSQLLKGNYEGTDSTNRMTLPSTLPDSLNKNLKYIYRLAKVVDNTVNSQANFLTIHRGSGQQVSQAMGVVSSEGIVGTVINVSENYSSVMSLLNRQFHTVAKLKKGGEQGLVEWDGLDPSYITLRNIPKSARVSVGDSVVTSQISDQYPPDIMVGTVSEIINDRSSNFYTLKLKTATNFFNVEYVYVVDNTQHDELRRFEDSTRKKIQ
jgi:rod shape-determining protein MreC